MATVQKPFDCMNTAVGISIVATCLCAVVQGQVFSSVTTVSGVPAESYTQATSFGSQFISYPAISPTSSHGGEISNPDPANCTLKTSVPSVSASKVVLNGTITRFYFDGSGPYTESIDKTVTLYTTTIVNSYTCSPPPTPEPGTYASIFGIALVGFGGYRKWAGKR